MGNFFFNHMRKIIYLFSSCFTFLQLHAQTIPFEVAEAPVYSNPNRIGLNIGSWSTYGAEQLSANIVMNPGFEGSIDRVFVYVNESDTYSFYDQNGWGYTDHYWDGASFLVQTGVSAGATGTIATSLSVDPITGLPIYTATAPLPTLNADDVIVLTQQLNTDPVQNWWIPFPALVAVDSTDPRPGSPGTQSLQLSLPSSGDTGEVDFYIDTEFDHLSTSFLRVNGKWQFSIWAKTDAEDGKLFVMFRRIGATPFIYQDIDITSEWKQYTINFDATDADIPFDLQLQLKGDGTDGTVWIDDVVLGPVQSNSTFPFRKEVVTLLSQLRPSYLRDTQGQLGDTFVNRVANILGRRSVASRAYTYDPAFHTCYSVGDLLTLCKAVRSNPWIVVPPVLSNEEAFAFGQYLAQYASKKDFSDVIVEFGNENWNYLFRATGIPYPAIHGVVAEQLFKNIARGAGRSVNLTKVVNGQYVNPSLTLDFLNSTPIADGIGVAPYFFYELNAGSDEVANLTNMFATDTYMQDTLSLMCGSNKRLMVYETNLSTVSGDASEEVRASYTAGAAAGSALAMQLINNLLLAVDPQVVFSFSQFDIYSWAAGGFVRLWGVTRDLSPTLLMRPQGLAILMLNQVIGGKVYSVPQQPSETSSNIAIAAFQQEDLWNAAAVNPNPDPATISITFPDDSRGVPDYMLVLNAETPLTTNEDSENVTILRQNAYITDRTVTVTIPAWGFVTLVGGEPLPECTFIKDKSTKK